MCAAAVEDLQASTTHATPAYQADSSGCQKACRGLGLGIKPSDTSGSFECVWSARRLTTNARKLWRGLTWLEKCRWVAHLPLLWFAVLRIRLACDSITLTVATAEDRCIAHSALCNPACGCGCRLHCSMDKRDNPSCTCVCWKLQVHPCLISRLQAGVLLLSCQVPDLKRQV